MMRTVQPLIMMLLLPLGATTAADLNVSVEPPEENTTAVQARRLEWARFSDLSCVKQAGAHMSQCIPCKKHAPDGTEVDRFVGPCKRDATVLASQIFTPWHFCRADGGCDQGRLPKFRGRVCWAFNKGEFTRFQGPAGVCIKEWWRSRHIPTVSYALANMAHGWRNVADFVAAYQWSMEQRKGWGDRPETVMTCQLFCNGQKACGEVGNCACGAECGPTTTLTVTTTTPCPEGLACTTTTITTTVPCYGELSAVVAGGEGNGVGEIQTTSETDCKNACNNNARCKSFALCPNYRGCYMKDRSISGGEGTYINDTCKTYYKKPCDGVIASPTASPIASPMASPAASPTASPTASATASPAASPTASPMTSPTASPTASPTDNPTRNPTAGPTVIRIAEPIAAPTAKPRPLPKVRKLKCMYRVSTQTLECTWLAPRGNETLVNEYQMRAKRVGDRWSSWSSNGLATKYHNKSDLLPGRYMFQVRICSVSSCGKQRTSKHRVTASQPTRRLIVV